MSHTPGSFEPIAIVGRSCILPGAHSPEELWDAVVNERDLISSVPRSYWRLSEENDAAHPETAHRSSECVATNRGGHVQGFGEGFDPSGFRAPAAEIAGLDPIFHWILQAGRECLESAGMRLPSASDGGALPGGMILGNLAYPTAGLAEFAERHWLGLAPEGSDPRNRFSSGFPIQFAARALGLSGESFGIDAACASSLYAIKLCCDRLQAGDASFMIAGGVNRADNLFLHMGFHALGASSKTGQSRPFHRHADGLIPSEGIAMVLLKRLADAEKNGDRILGVIRGIGLSNDGRAQGLLAPSAEGQVRAMLQAYRLARLQPADMQLIECHATGTSVGDAIEIQSMTQVFGGGGGNGAKIPIGSLKSNTGHLISAAGAAALVKVLSAFEHGTLPPTRNVEDELESIGPSPFRLLRKPEKWDSRGPRRAAISAFGFGGNNAHLIVEQWIAGASSEAPVPAAKHTPGAVAIVGMATMVGESADVAAFARATFGENSTGTRSALQRHCEEIRIPANALRFPPHDLQLALPQQMLALRAAIDAVADAGELPRERTAVLVGMQCDAEIARCGARWRLPNLPHGAGATGDSFHPELAAGGVVGTMPNIAANRINSQFDFKGPGYVVFSEELSGLTALKLGMRALLSGEVDAALVGAVDMSCETVHATAARRVLGNDGPGAADAAIMFVLKRAEDAERDGDRVYAMLPGEEKYVEASPPLVFSAGGTGIDLAQRFGHAHAASGMLQVAGAALSCFLRAVPGSLDGAGYPWLPAGAPRSAKVVVRSFAGGESDLLLEQSPGAPGTGWLTHAEFTPAIRCFSGRDHHDVLLAIQRGEESADGPARLVWLSTSASEDRQQREIAVEALSRRGEKVPYRLARGLYYRPAPLEGELSFVFTFAAAAYAGMARELFLALPELLDGMGERFDGALQNLSWIYEKDSSWPSHMDQLRGFSLLCHAHTCLTREILGLRPSAVIGISSGESSSLFCMGAWDRPEKMFREIEESGLYSLELAGEFRAVERSWKALGQTEPVRWGNWRIFLPVAQIRAAIDGEAFAHILLIHSPDDCVIGGRYEDCERVIGRLCNPHCLKVENPMAAHCPEVQEFAAEWRAIHLRPTTQIPSVRFYSNAGNRHYELSSDAVADALLGQALATVDFPATILQAWEDGVRIFVEHGPWGLCSDWISEILKGRDHLVLSLDRAGEPPVKQALDVAAQLLAAGAPLVTETLIARLRNPYGRGPASLPGEGRYLTLRGHFPEVDLNKHAKLPRAAASSPTAMPEPQFMAPAPVRPPLAGASRPASRLREEPAATPVALMAREEQVPISFAAVALQTHAAVHRRWVETQAEMHVRFLDFRQRLLLTVAGTGGSLPRIPAAAVNAPTGPAYSRRQLEILSEGKISSVFGEIFAEQDQYERQVRMPMPPLLLADRVTGVEATPLVLGTGTIRTETDVRDDSWYLHQGRMPAGIMIEAGQADLLLISWMGADFLNCGERVYRLLGCELTYHGELPRAGETLAYAIHIDAHARQDDVRLFFFHYDCNVAGELRLSVRGGQAGFFTREELDNSSGVLWDPYTLDAPPLTVLDPPAVSCTRSAFTKEQIQSFSRGDAFACFGPGFEMAQTHVRTPRIQGGDMLLIDEVTHFDPAGGPWGRGYLRAVLYIRPDHWFFKGHFKNDPCMPGTLMFEGCLQAMAMYLAALGYTLERDGWRFEPVPEEKVQLSCRGQVLPSAKEVVCELFVRDVSAGPLPALHTDLLGTVDGLKAFHAQNMGYRLVPDWPIGTYPELLANYVETKPIASAAGFEFGYKSLLSCAWGKPSDAFGPMYAGFDGTRRVARLPGPPYHFMTRVTKLEGEMGVPRAGAYAELEYDIPEDAWYFEENSARTMPMCVLLEAALQPCGWLASYIGCSLGSEEDLAFRNLDGTGTAMVEIRPGARLLTTKVRVTQVSGAGGMIILGFEVHCDLDQVPAYRMSTVFGFFPVSSLKNQAGLPSSPSQQAFLEEHNEFLVDLTAYPERYFRCKPCLPASRLLMVDRITGFWPRGGSAGRGKLRGEKDVRHSEWFFKAHFFQDPVQPGSLGIEALLQLLQFYMIESGLGAGLQNPRFEPVMLGEPMTWKYRGQVVPDSKTIVSEMEIIETGEDENGAFAVGSGNLYVDGKRIYQASPMGMRVVAGDAPEPVADIRPFWRRQLKTTHAPLENFFQALVTQFVQRVVFTAPEALQEVRDRGVLYLGNHQCQIESMLFLIAVSALRERPIIALANAKHQHRWLGELIARSFSFPGMTDPDLIRYFEQSQPESLPRILAELRAGLSSGERSVLIHVEGTRQLSCREPVTKISSAPIDLALDANVPIVPVRFTRGLPVEPLISGKLEFPAGYGGQVYWIGEPILPNELRALSLVARKQRVLSAIQSLGPDSCKEMPAPPDLALVRAVKLRMENSGLDEVKAVLSVFAEQCEVGAGQGSSREEREWGQTWERWIKPVRST